MSSLTDRLRRYSQLVITNALDPDFANAVWEAADRIELIEGQPSVGRIAGPAIKIVKDGFWYASSFVCSECEGEADSRYRFCPHCGAKMERVEESNG